MNKEQKAEVVERLTEELKGAEAIFAIDYRGISVPQAAELRSGLRDADTSFRVVKNRLTLRAADAAGTEGIKPYLTGPTALALVTGDVALAAKTLSRLGDEWELLSYKGGLMGSDELDADGFKAIAKLPGRDQLNAQFAGIVASPLTGLVRGLGSMVQGLAIQLQAIADQGLVTGEAPKAEEAPKEEAASEEVDAPAGGGDGSASEDAGAAAEDASSDAASDPDPDPQDSPEEAPSEEEAPEGESATPVTEGGGGEGDQDLGEEEAQEETSESSTEEAADEAAKKEEGD